VPPSIGMNASRFPTQNVLMVRGSLRSASRRVIRSPFSVATAVEPPAEGRACVPAASVIACGPGPSAGVFRPFPTEIQDDGAGE